MIDHILDYCVIEDIETTFIGEKYNDCLIGVSYVASEDFIPVYNLNNILKIIMKDYALSESDSIIFFNENILDKYPLVSFLYYTDGSREDLANYNVDMLFLDGYSDNCLLGVRFRHGYQVIAAYDDFACVQNLVSDGMVEEDALEYFEYNTRGSYYNNNTPAIITLL